MAQNQKSYDNEFKAQAVKLAQEIGGHKAAQELGIPKRILVMVGTKKALAYAVRNVTVTRRNTLLKERLAGQIQVKKPAKIYYPDFSGTAEDTRMVGENRSDYGN